MRRRSFVGSLAAGLAGAGSAGAIDLSTVRAHLEELSLFGRPAGGTFQGGVSRVGYSDADIAGRKFMMDLLAKAGARVRIDAAGNIFATRSGADASLRPLLFGSHIDSVANGGNFDGDLGVVAALNVLRVAPPTRRPLTVVIWACEEASFSGTSLNGSRAAAGLSRAGELEQVSRGMTKAEAIRRVGGDPLRIEQARIKPGDYHAYVELHIEQGGTLERDRVPVGVVDGIVSIDDYTVVVKGFQNHAGTTPMANRQDALIAAAQLTLAIREEGVREPGGQVATVGHMEVSPNAVNVIPGEVRMSIDIRDLSSAKLERIGARIQERARAIAAETRTTISMARSGHNEAALAAPEVQRAIEGAASKLRLDTKHLPSGAGHDAQSMAPLMPMGMIFVPSIGGVSHSPAELTSWQDCANGANVLLETVLALAG